ncbi:MAG: nucleotidyltransferase domain-containing protein [Polaromonas sp.]
MHVSIQRQLNAIGQVCAKYGIAKLEVFGSAARSSDFSEKSSDADFLVEFLPSTQPGLDEFFGAKAELEIILKRDIDLVQAKAVNNPYVLASINLSRELVYAAT